PIGVRNNIYRDVRTGCKRAGVEYASPNDWRRCHAAVLAEHGLDRDVTRRFLGHTSTEMVDRAYSRPRVAAVAALAEASIATTAARSSGVVEVVTDGLCSEGMTVAKCSKSFEAPSNNVVYLGLRSRRSVVRIHSGALNSCGLLRDGLVSSP